MITTNISKFDQQRLTLVKYKINEIRDKITDEDLNKSNQHDWKRGGRFNDNDYILRVLLGTIFSECNRDHEAANKRLVSLNSMHTEPYIKKALLDTSYTDYYYTYEKNHD